ncbi:hypothetical protein I1H34_15070 [Acaryochloris marina S15]|nr:hypothetical protein [Acaryochloris marina]QUY40644.1 hypothetical protein I1H34_15070 [Acaryochloris marina S15]
MAVLGDIDQFIPLLQLEAHKQDFESAPKVIWLSDGGRGFWRVYRTLFSHCAVAVLDFFHSAGHLARATKAMFGDARSAQAQAWFRHWRHQLRHGQHLLVLRSLTILIHSQLLTGKSFQRCSRCRLISNAIITTSVIGTLNSNRFLSGQEWLKVHASG